MCCAKSLWSYLPSPIQDRQGVKHCFTIRSGQPAANGLLKRAFSPKKPTGAPRLIDSNESTLSLEKLRQDIPKYHLHFDSETIKWWEEFLESEGPVPSTPPQWMLPKLKKQPVTQPKQPHETNPKQDISETLTRLVEKEEHEVEVWH